MDDLPNDWFIEHDGQRLVLDPEKVTAGIDAAIAAERERCAAFAFAKHDWPARWIAASFRGENSAYHDFETDPPARIMSA